MFRAFWMGNSLTFRHHFNGNLNGLVAKKKLGSPYLQFTQEHFRSIVSCIRIWEFSQLASESPELFGWINGKNEFTYHICAIWIIHLCCLLIVRKQYWSTDQLYTEKLFTATKSLFQCKQVSAWLKFLFQSSCLPYSPHQLECGWLTEARHDLANKFIVFFFGRL